MLSAIWECHLVLWWSGIFYCLGFFSITPQNFTTSDIWIEIFKFCSCSGWFILGLFELEFSSLSARLGKKKLFFFFFYMKMHTVIHTFKMLVFSLNLTCSKNQLVCEGYAFIFRHVPKCNTHKQALPVSQPFKQSYVCMYRNIKHNSVVSFEIIQGLLVNGYGS